ncbi:hypothetical protein [Pararhizobium arenae]|uniref:hypothetical protein n=1 Tax=Pararhizobium arenae TaxID=1856850 RepID=UPI00094B5C7A|nr:hypothetical protein [Pararhizobium arenae]
MTALSRRTLLGGGAAVAAAAVVSRDELAWIEDAKAEATGPSPDIALKTEIDAAFEHLRSLLMKMHPQAVNVAHGWVTNQDGSFRGNFYSQIKYQPFDGDGLYLLSMDGLAVPYWIEAFTVLNGKGEPMLIGGKPITHYWGWQLVDGEFFDRSQRFVSLNIIRKLDDPSDGFSDRPMSA